MYLNLNALTYPLPEDVERLMFGGDFERARRVIAQRLADSRTPKILHERLRYALRIMQDLEEDYTVSETEMLAALQKKLKDFLPEEMEAFRDDGSLDWIYLNGQIRYKDNALSSLLKTHPDLAPRIEDPSFHEAQKKRREFLANTIARMKENGHMHVRMRLKTTLSVEPSAQRPGERIRVYLPVPLKHAQCTPAEILTDPPAAYVSAEGHPQRTACFDTVYRSGMTFSTDFSWEMDAPYQNPDPSLVLADQPHFDTEELLPHIRFTPFIRALTEELKGEETNPLLIARRFYDYVTTNACYRYVPSYFSKTDIPAYFGAGLHGDCGMHALLFITLCRCAGIPTQWQSGLCIDTDGVGCHDWARFYVAPYGWLWVDGSFGGSAYRDGDLDRWNFYFGNIDPWRLVADRDFQCDFDPPMKHLRGDPYDSQSGEAEYEDRSLLLSETETEWELIECKELP